MMQETAFGIESEFQDGGIIPSRHTCDGENINPRIEIVGAPPETKSFAIIMDDPDAPNGTFTHWTVWNIELGLIPEDSVPGVQGMNDFGRIGYGGPCPPSGTHRYFFKAFALDTMLDLNEGASRALIEKAMEGHIIARSELLGRYGR
jgi:Raf kinase inhibitor-like YbhB/YbcL family protein